jgi:hypothetical protein
LIRYPEKFDYTRTLSKSMFYYEANMLGTLPPGWVLLSVSLRQCDLGYFA